MLLGVPGTKASDPPPARPLPVGRRGDGRRRRVGARPAGARGRRSRPTPRSSFKATKAVEPRSPPLLAQPRSPGDQAEADVVDLTDSVVAGSGPTAGDTTEGGGEPPNAAIAREVSHVRAASPRPDPSTDLSRKPALAGGAEWACPFPPEADGPGKDSAVVSIRVKLDASGAVHDVDLQRPGTRVRACRTAAAPAPNDGCRPSIAWADRWTATS
jgi:hypothetical protein